MELELNIEDLLNKRKIESFRIEFKTGWNPDDIYQNICAFANDYDNVGGGYIAIGVEEHNGIAKRPIHGIPDEMMDKIQRDIVGYNHKLRPAYSPHIVTDIVDEKNIMVLWVPSGNQRPYKVPEYVTKKKGTQYKTYIRYGTSTVIATQEQERELLMLSANEPFDELGNPKATINDISPILLMDHLRKTGSRLEKQVMQLGVEEILEQMHLLTGPSEMRRVKNVALMMFCETPDRFFPYTQVEMVKFPNGSIKDPKNFIDIPPIKGSVPQIISRTMEKLKDLAIEDYVQKVPDRMEANRYTSYPYEALEEAVVNAFYHRDYLSHEPVHVEIEPDFICIISYPGIDRSIPMDVIKKGERFKARTYRNRRLGEFLKELNYTEAKCTGIPTIQDELRKNGSPAATFETDEERRAVTVTIPIQPEYFEYSNISKKYSYTYPYKYADSTGKNVDQAHDAENGGLNGGLKHDLADKIIDVIRENQSVTVDEMAERADVPKRSVERELQRLRERGVISRQGAKKNGYWEIIDN